MALKYPAAEGARLVHNDKGELCVVGKNWSLQIEEDTKGGIRILALHKDSHGVGSKVYFSNPKV